MAQPIIKLADTGKVPLINYNVPEPTSYTGRNLIELDVLDVIEDVDIAEIFNEEVLRKPQRREIDENISEEVLKNEVLKEMRTGFSNQKLFPNARMTTNSFRFGFDNGTIFRRVDSGDFGESIDHIEQKVKVLSTVPTSDKVENLDPDEVVAKLKQGFRLNFYTQPITGIVKHNFIPEPKEVRPRLFIVETYRLSTYLGQYGAGRVIKTFSLLPGEKTEISVKSYTKKTTDSKQASSILDSVTQESADEFEKSIQSEVSDKKSAEESFEYYADVEAEGSWGVGSASAKAGVKGGSHSAREEFKKNIMNSTQKHAAKSSSKRDIQINTSYEVKEESGEETSITREIENINLSRTLNFVFRQMNQEFITFLHLTDIRIGFFNGYAESRKEVTLREIDKLMKEVIKEPFRDAVKKMILNQVQFVIDYKEDKPQEFVVEKNFTINGEEIKYFGVKNDIVTEYIDDITQQEIDVPGVIISFQKNVMRTEGVMVEALLGEGEALDDYAKNLQQSEVKRQEAEANLKIAQAETIHLMNQFAQEKNEVAANILKDVMCPCVSKMNHEEE